MQRLLEDLVVCGSVTYDAVQDWQHDNKDQTPGKEAAIKDSAKLVASLAAKDAENTDINNCALPQQAAAAPVDLPGGASAPSCFCYRFVEWLVVQGSEHFFTWAFHAMQLALSV